MQTEIYYLLCYDVNEKKWYSADFMLGNLTQNKGQVLEGDGAEGTFRPLQEGMEADIDFDNTEALTRFIQEQNSSQN